MSSELTFTSERDLLAYKIDCDSINSLLSNVTLPKILDFEEDISKGYVNSYEGKKAIENFNLLTAHYSQECIVKEKEINIKFGVITKEILVDLYQH